MTFEKAVKETDRLLVYCDRLRAKQEAIEDKIKALQKQRKEVNAKWNSYEPAVTKARDVIAKTLKEKYAHLIGGYYRSSSLKEPFFFKISDIYYGWNEKSLEHRDMLGLVTCTSVLDGKDLVIYPEWKFTVYAKDLVSASEEEFLDYISKAKYEYKQGYAYGYLSWEKTEIER